MSQPALPEIFVARHGETAWSLSGQHTGLTDIPLTAKGERDARSLVGRLAGLEFTEVLTSPLQRASQTCDLAGFEGRSKADPDLVEWNYGQYEGLKTAEIRALNPDWYIFRDGCPGGESLLDIGTRADRVIARLRRAEGRVIVFSHGHFCRVLAARWLGLLPGDARFFVLATTSLSILGFDHNADEPVIKLWNDRGHLVD